VSVNNLKTPCVALALALAVTCFSERARAQQVPAAPRPPGQAEPTPAPGTATPAPAATVPTLPSPTASAEATPQSALPSAGRTTPAPSPVPDSTSPAPGQPEAQPSGVLVRFSGQLLDLRNGYVYFTTGDAFKASPTLQIVDLDTGAQTALVPQPRLYARATLDPGSGAVVELALTKHKIAADAAYAQAYALAHRYVVAGSPTIPAPELMHGQKLTGRAVAVTFFVQVPPTTPLTDNVYITTDASGWVANAMKMDRIDALHYRLTRTYASGTKFAYRYTRGAWTSVEVGEDGLQDDPHQFFVPEVDAKRLTDVVYRWSDQNPSQPQVGPDSIPTPFNPNPFGGLPTTIRPGIPAPSPTPRP
jgi:hypothetical protein